jgi:hypothetical protein
MCQTQTNKLKTAANSIALVSELLTGKVIAFAYITQSEVL